MPVVVRKPKTANRGQVAALRTRLGLSQEAVAQVLGVSSRTVARWEEGTATPSPLALARPRLLTEIREKAGRLFKSKEAEASLRTPNPVVRGRSPLEHLRMPGGLEEIRDLLGRIEWGIPA
jgi:DNA-binding transcriptional regulator YiaG